ncbi:unnamed protein product [Closterium sp. Naga37s-1]|nr:unnamed protein product [Closterium sp. Naga37s-1]
MHYYYVLIVLFPSYPLSPLLLTALFYLLSFVLRSCSPSPSSLFLSAPHLPTISIHCIRESVASLQGWPLFRNSPIPSSLHPSLNLSIPLSHPPMPSPRPSMPASHRVDGKLEEVLNPKKKLFEKLPPPSHPPYPHPPYTPTHLSHPHLSIPHPIRVDGKPEEVLNPKKKLLKKLQPFLRTDGTGVAMFQDTPMMTLAGPCTSTVQEQPAPEHFSPQPQLAPDAHFTPFASLQAHHPPEQLSPQRKLAPDVHPPLPPPPQAHPAPEQCSPQLQFAPEQPSPQQQLAPEA